MATLLSTDDLEELLDEAATAEETLDPAPIDPHHDFHEVTEDEIGIKIFFNDK